MRRGNHPVISLPISGWRLGVWRPSMQIRRISRSDAMVNIGVHIHVDIGRPLSGRKKTTTLRNSTNQDKVRQHHYNHIHISAI